MPMFRCTLMLICLLVSFTPAATAASLPQVAEKDTAASLASETRELMLRAVACKPHPRQADWQQHEFMGFIHFGVNTFTGREWGSGKEDPAIFDPAKCDTDQWCRAMKAAGMRMVILTAKHHDGFCLWPTRYTGHSVASSPWRDGKGDVVKDLSESCARFGLKLGIYLSPADLFQMESGGGLYGNESRYSRRQIPRPVPDRPFEDSRTFFYEVDDYNEYFMNQLFELLTEYGPIHEVWFDGAHPKRKGGQQYTYGQWYDLIRKLAPEAVIFGKGPDVRWCGNEAGRTRPAEWSVIPIGGSPDDWHWPDMTDVDLGSLGRIRKVVDAGGFLHWYPAETNTSIRHGWFFRDENQVVKSADEITDIWYRSVGGNTVFLLNIPPNRDGLFSERDCRVLEEVGRTIGKTFARNLAEGAAATATAVRGVGFEAKNVVDGDPHTAWMTPDWTRSAEVLVALPEERTFNRVMLSEPVSGFSQRIARFAVDARLQGEWIEIAKGETVGFKRICRTTSVTTKEVRIRILDSRVCPALNGFGLFLEPVRLTVPIIGRDVKGRVTLSCRPEGPRIRYTVDGSEPTAASPLYSKPFLLPGKGTVRARAFDPGEKRCSEEGARTFDLCPAKWKAYASSEQADSGEKAVCAIDGNPDTIWHSKWRPDAPKPPHCLIIDLGETVRLEGFTYLPRRGGTLNGTIRDYAIYVSRDNEVWSEPAAQGSFANIKNNPVEQQVRFDEPREGRFIKLLALSEVNDNPWASAAEIGVLTADAAPGDQYGARTMTLDLEAPIKTWDEAIPLGNGLMGGLLWGQGNEIKLSLDCSKLWDERLPEIYLEENWNYTTIRKLKAEGRQDEISRLFDHPYNQIPYPTKLPAGRLELTLDKAQQAGSFHLDMRRALGTVDLTEGALEVFYPATMPVAMIRHEGPAPELRFVRPKGLDRLGYDAALFGEGGGLTWMVQDAALGLRYAVVMGRKENKGERWLAVAIASNEDGKDPLMKAKRRVTAALDRGYETLLRPHLAWWDEFWSLSDVSLPDERIERHYNLCKYFYGAASRPDTPPMPLQGVWTRDDGGLPPWKGDYHHDLNTQMTYLAYHAAGLLDAGLSFVNINWELLPVYRRFARSFYGVEGAAMPGVATLAGKPTAGWSQYALSPTNALWVGQTFHLHWLYTMDQEFLAARAYPWLSAMAEGIVGLLEERGGKLYLPLSSSPEIHNNSLKAWLVPNSNYDLALMQWAFEALAEMADALDRGTEADRWRGLRAKLDDLLVDDRNVLMFSRNEPFNESHRHHSHTMAIHPLGTLHVEGSDRDRAVIDATLDRIHELGTQLWTGYSFSWFSCLLARCGRAELALDYLVDYERAFILRNGFHVNGDQIGAGLSQFRYRPFTLEGNFLAMEAVHEMLLQSWGGKVRVFPAVSERWKDAAFDGLRAQGGFKVSARREDGRTTRVSVEATVDQRLRLRNPFADQFFQMSRPAAKSGDLLVWDLKAGESVVLEAASTWKRQSRIDPHDSHDSLKISLAGQWRFRLDPDDQGGKEEWFNTSLPDSIALPGTTDLAGKGYRLDRDSMSYGREFFFSKFPAAAVTPRADEWGFLVRDPFYMGKAWYQKEIVIPEAWAGKHVRLFLERVIWAATVWIDGALIGSGDSLAAPHCFDLGILAPGRHRLTLCVDNSMQQNIGTIGHAYGPETQSRWNGVVGRIELRASPPLFLRRLAIHPAADRKSVRVAATINNASTSDAAGTLDFEIRDEKGEEIHGSSRCEVIALPGESQVVCEIEVKRPVEQWDEFSTTRYTLLATCASPLGRHALSDKFGFRRIERDGNRILVNGRRIFLRGTLDCCVYPRTGHPPVTIEEWLRVLGTIKDHGFNHVRYHSWCPPEAAFEAADRLGLYLAAETAFWVDDWTRSTVTRPEGLGRDEESTAFVRREIRRISEAYGNHPSFAFFCIGNEFGMQGTDWGRIDALVEEAKASDPRRLYNATTARRRLAADDFWVTHNTGKGGTRGVGPPHTNWDFSRSFAPIDLPVVAHETGQRPVFPDYETMLPKFTGPLKPLNYKRLQGKLKEAGLAGRIEAFHRASARFQMVQYKAEHEALLRTREAAGYQLLMLNDFTGQSEALVGILDPFWESKGVAAREEVLRWNAPTVLLARFDRFTWSLDETFGAAIEVAHYGPSNLRGVSGAWSLRTPSGEVVCEGSFGPVDVQAGAVTLLDVIGGPLAMVRRAEALLLSVSLGEVRNEWTVWVYPPWKDEVDSEGCHLADSDDESTGDAKKVLLATSFDETVQEAVTRGGRVLLTPRVLKRPFVKRTGFLSVYWSAGWWGDAFSSLGIVCDPDHPALAGFPSEGHSDWQWHTLVQDALTFDLTGRMKGIEPIVQPVSDFHHNRLLAHLFEVRVGEGSLLVCGYDLQTELTKRHAARQMRRSLLQYMNSPAFDPGYTISMSAVEEMFLPPLMSRLDAGATADSSSRGNEADKAIDGDPSTIWHTAWEEGSDLLPHHLVIDLKKPIRLSGLTYLPRQEMANGRIAQYEIAVSLDGKKWSVPVASGEWPNDAALKTITFDRPVDARFVKLVALREVNGEPWTSAAEVEVIPQ